MQLGIFCLPVFCGLKMHVKVVVGKYVTNAERGCSTEFAEELKRERRKLINRVLHNLRLSPTCFKIKVGEMGG